MTPLDTLKLETFESECPYYSDEQLAYFLEKHGQDLEAACYDILLRKSMNSQLQISGYTSQDTSGFFKRMASRYRPAQSGTIPLK